MSGTSKQRRSKRSQHTRQILEIINDIEKRIRVIETDAILHRELHEKRVIDNRRETAEFEEVRRDLCEAFDVPIDDSHVYLHSASEQGAVEQRAQRVFYVLIDTMKGEGYYGGGRTDHNTLFLCLVELAGEYDQSVNFESVVSNLDGDPPKYLVFKGFLSTDNFASLSEAGKKILESPMRDGGGNVIETAKIGL